MKRGEFELDEKSLTDAQISVLSEAAKHFDQFISTVKTDNNMKDKHIANLIKYLTVMPKL